jgi:hypothetical protein
MNGSTNEEFRWGEQFINRKKRKKKEKDLHDC